MNEEYKLSEETATEQLQLIYDYYGFTKEQADAFKLLIPKQINDVIKGIRLGKIEISNDADGFKVIQHAKNSNFAYGEFSLLIAEVAGKETRNMQARAIQVLAALSKEPVQKIHAMTGQDAQIALALGMLFLSWL